MPNSKSVRITKSTKSNPRNRRMRSRRKRISDTPQQHPLLQLQQTIGNQAVARMIQAKLSISQPGDKYESEADQVADKVMRMPEPVSTEDEGTTVQAKSLANQITPFVQRALENQPDEDESLVQAKSEEVPDQEAETIAANPLIHRQPLPVQDENEEPVQTKFAIQREVTEDDEDGVQTKSVENNQCFINRTQIQPKAVRPAASRVPPAVAANINNLTGRGRPLPQTTRAFFEPRFGADFSQVRIHTDHRAAETAKSMNARAFTLGKNIAFGTVQYAPESNEGRRLLGHELTHVIQQGGGDLQRNDMKPGISAVVADNNRIQRWARSGNMVTSNKEGDTLWGLAKSITGKGKNWPCIKPLNMHSTKATGEYYYLYVMKGDTFDVSNLTATSGTALRLHFFDQDQAIDANFANSWYGATGMSGIVDNDIESAANFGGTPIHSLVLFGHSGGGDMWGGLGRFTPGDFFPDDDTPTKEQAERGMFPRRCWFTHNAVVRLVGCNSSQVGTDFAKAYLRHGATVITTTASVLPKCRGLPEILANLMGNTGGCVWYNGAEFNSSPVPGAGATLDGPFWSRAAFHGGAFWKDIPGKN